jgi:ArsR family transcriptional regulator
MKKFRDVKYCIPTAADAGLTEKANASFNSQAVHMADALRALAHPARWMLVSKLMDSECSVTELERQLSIHQPTLSQQLTVLRNANIIEARRQSKNVFYRLSAGKPMQLIREIDRIFVLRVRAFE